MKVYKYASAKVCKRKYASMPVYKYSNDIHIFVTNLLKQPISHVVKLNSDAMKNKAGPMSRL